MSEMPKDCIYECPLSQEEIAEALKPFSKKNKKTILESLVLMTHAMDIKPDVTDMIVNWGDMIEAEVDKAYISTFGYHLPEMIAEIRKIIWTTVRFNGLNQNWLMKQSKEIREKISLLERYLDNPQKFFPAYYVPCGVKLS